MPYKKPPSKIDYPLPNQFNQYLAGNQDGSVNWKQFPFLAAMFNSTTVSNLRIYTAVANSVRPSGSQGHVTFYPTSDSTASGTPIFSQILFAYAISLPGEKSSNDTHALTGRIIAADRKSVSFNVIKGGLAFLGGAGTRAGDANTPCVCFIIGVPA